MKRNVLVMQFFWGQGKSKLRKRLQTNLLPAVPDWGRVVSMARFGRKKLQMVIFERSLILFILKVEIIFEIC